MGNTYYGVQAVEERDLAPAPRSGATVSSPTGGMASG